MHVVGHQHVSMHLDLLRLAVLQQHIQHAFVVGRGFEDVLTVVAAQNHMMRVTRNRQTRKSSHRKMVMEI